MTDSKPSLSSAPMNCCQHCRHEFIKENIYKHPELICNMFLACKECGNKRCPKAIAHWNKCTGSNEPNQVGETDINEVIKLLRKNQNEG